MTSIVKSLLIDFKARGENYDHLILTSSMVLVPGHPPVPSASGPQLLTECQDIFQPDKPSSPFGEGEMDSHLVKIRLVTAPCDHMEVWSTSFFFYGAMNSVLPPDSAILYLSLPELSLLSFPIALGSPSQQVPAFPPLSANCPQPLSLLWSPCPLCWLCQIHVLALVFRDWHQYLAPDSTASFQPLGECFTDYKETMNREKG